MKKSPVHIKSPSALKMVALLIAGVGMIVSNELQRRETREIVEEVIAEREARAPEEL